MNCKVIVKFNLILCHHFNITDLLIYVIIYNIDETYIINIIDYLNTKC